MTDKTSDDSFQLGMEEGELQGIKDARAGLPERPQPPISAELYLPQYKVGYVSGYLHGHKKTEIEIALYRQELLRERMEINAPERDAYDLDR